MHCADANQEDNYKAPQWFLDLEDRLQLMRKEKPLAHEVGAGALCLKCKCPGLDLHFWRKICIKCKCKKDEHDVPSEGYDIRSEILWGPPKGESLSSDPKPLVLEFQQQHNNSKNSFMQAMMQDSTNPSKSVRFDWLPDVPHQLALEYMENLPSTKLPVTGTSGAKFRKMQLALQIPLHDITPEMNKNLSPTAQKVFQEHLQNIRENVGQGNIKRIYQEGFVENSVPYSTLPAPEYTKPMKQGQQTTVQDKITVPPNSMALPPLPRSWEAPSTIVPLSTTENKRSSNTIPTTVLRLPSSFIGTKSSNVSSVGQALKSLQLDPYVENTTDKRNNNENDEKQPVSNYLATNQIVPTPPLSNNAIQDPLSTTDENRNAQTKARIAPFQNESYQLPQNPPTNVDAEETCMNVDPSLHGNTSTSTGFDMGPGKHNPSSWHQHDSQVKENRPNQDLAINQPITRNGTVKQSEGKDSDTGQTKDDEYILTVQDKRTCVQCERVIQFGSLAIVVNKETKIMTWHPECFVCYSCQELLVDMIYFMHDGHTYCERHFALMKKIPRCQTCDELIFGKQYTYTEDGSYYHPDHFRCGYCEKELGGFQYVLTGDDLPTCLDCCELFISKRCHTCKLSIKPTEKGVHFRQLNWHAYPNCFKCATCQEFLMEKKGIMLNKDWLFCSTKCKDLLNSTG